MVEVSRNEPVQLVAGDTWKWTRELVDYPASDGWTLHYYFRGPNDAAFDFAATPAGDDHAVTVAATDTQTYTAGGYDWQAFASKGGERYKVDQGRLTVEANFAAPGAGFDPRPHPRRVLAAIEAVIEGRATKDQENYSIAGRSLSRTPIADLLRLRDQYRAEVARLDDAADLAAGLPSKRSVFVRFS